MPPSNPTITPGSLDIGPCIFKFGGTDLGSTLDNVTVTFKYTKADLKVDQLGKTVVDRAIDGIEVTVETAFAETRSQQLLGILFPNATVTTSGSQKAVTFSSGVTNRDRQITGLLTLHPMVEAASSLDYDWNFYCAAPSEESGYTFGPSEQAKFKMKFNIYPDFSTNPPRFFKRGAPYV